MRYLGIDYGTKRIGISISDEAGGFAFPKETIPNDATSIDRIARMIKDERVGTLVVGDTRALNGEENPITREAQSFADALRGHVGIPVESVREAFSSTEAGRFAPKGKHDDAAAAAIILQRYLDAHQKAE